MVAVPCNEVVPGERGEGVLHTRRPTEAVSGAYVGGEHLTAALEDNGAQHASLSQSQPLPERLEHHLLFGEQSAECLMEILQRHLPAPSRSNLIPRFMREALDVVQMRTDAQQRPAGTMFLDECAHIESGPPPDGNADVAVVRPAFVDDDRAYGMRAPQPLRQQREYAIGGGPLFAPEPIFDDAPRHQ